MNMHVRCSSTPKQPTHPGAQDRGGPGLGLLPRPPALPLSRAKNAGSRRWVGGCRPPAGGGLWELGCRPPPPHRAALTSSDPAGKPSWRPTGQTLSCTHTSFLLPQ